jgi:hypothetical protein
MRLFTSLLLRLTYVLIRVACDGTDMCCSAYLDYCERHFSGAHQVPEFLQADADRLRQLARGYACTPRAHEVTGDYYDNNDDNTNMDTSVREHKLSPLLGPYSSSRTKSPSTATTTRDNENENNSNCNSNGSIGRAPPTTVLPCQHFLLYPSQGVRDRYSHSSSNANRSLPAEQRVQFAAQFGNGGDDSHFHAAFFLLLKYCARHVGMPLLRLQTLVDGTVRILRQQLGRTGYTRSLHTARMQRYLAQKRLMAQVRRARELRKRRAKTMMKQSYQEQKRLNKQKELAKAIGDVIGHEAAAAVAALPPSSSRSSEIQTDSELNGEVSKHSKLSNGKKHSKKEKKNKGTRVRKPSSNRVGKKKNKKKAKTNDSDTSNDDDSSGSNYSDTRSTTKKKTKVQFAVPAPRRPRARVSSSADIVTSPMSSPSSNPLSSTPSSSTLPTDSETETDMSPAITPLSHQQHAPVVPSPLTLLSAPTPSIPVPALPSSPLLTPSSTSNSTSSTTTTRKRQRQSDDEVDSSSDSDNEESSSDNNNRTSKVAAYSVASSMNDSTKRQKQSIKKAAIVSASANAVLPTSTKKQVPKLRR